ncbi:MAG: MetQ/NlpA family ABC transporter substrate-binding protein [Cellulomonas sp.]|uniref:MetQ/NlpA family ABC transporter substrate-binding protein n=1 Tax=Cellulomonas sp. TaxID=40001 RepID=UPI0025904733|nr:MetQ/NlpA family ABC transporter substrate-binding protein [Cellulomonas sp.]MCR6703771.1 MetQ/NlpA family ABC transporter substrate-binding protein [Cellulomonas sp.]
MTPTTTPQAGAAPRQPGRPSSAWARPRSRSRTGRSSRRSPRRRTSTSARRLLGVTQPNPALADGEIDLNAFQHVLYLADHNNNTGTT